jgi:glutamate racemase
MEDYIEDYKYNNCFWKKSGVLYNHGESKFKEYLSIADMFQAIAKSISNACGTIEKVPSLYKQSDDKNSTRGEGILVILHCIKVLNIELKKLSKNINSIATVIFEKNDSYQSKKQAMKMCDDCYKKYQNELTKLSQVKKIYFDTMNKTIEYYLSQKIANKIRNGKIDKELENRKNILKSKKMDYKKQIENVEKARVEYMEFQGNIFASEEEFERECTDELKNYFKKFIGILQDIFKNFSLSSDQLAIIEEINGEKDNKSFAEKNKSLMTGPKRKLYKEYAQDLNYYCEHFDCIKSKLKGKSSKEIREINNKITHQVNEFLEDIIKEEPDQIRQRIIQIAKDIKENRLSKKDYEYLENQFQKSYEKFKKWKDEKVKDQDYKKVGKEWDDRFCYMHTFLGYFNKTRVENKELDKTNFGYLVKAIKKILELNENEDIDYSLCDLVVILSSTFYTADPNGKNGKKYITEVVKNCSIMQRQGFWVGLTRFELNEEIQQQNKIEDTLKEDNVSEEKLNNSVIAKLMSVSYNIIQFVMDSKLFNKIINDIFKYCKINAENKEVVVEMIEGQIANDNLNHLKLDKELLLSIPKTTPDEVTIEKTNPSNK